MTAPATSNWPSLRVPDWTATRDTLHMWTQIVGKTRMAHAPLVNHWWQVALYVSPRGLTTSAVPYLTGAFEIEFDFVGHRLEVRSSDGGVRGFPLRPMPVAEFYAQILHALDALGIEAPIHPHPNEVEPAIPFAEEARISPLPETGLIRCGLHPLYGRARTASCAGPSVPSPCFADAHVLVGRIPPPRWEMSGGQVGGDHGVVLQSGAGKCEIALPARTGFSRRIRPRAGSAHPC
ncbi:hypothetical protein GCM10022384_52880 [Streptomyces marokkonensis]|uniref:Uncharacterized protein n=1 Tax=Streptomyces marokkonensis TaxID=324855 RepID=A0ABP7RLH5_9ACTN